MKALLLLLALGLVPAAFAAPDLGDGLLYYRVHDLPRDLPTAPGGKPSPSVVDLRFAKSGEIGAAALRAWVKFNASPRSPVFILENAATAPALLASFPASGQAGLVVLAPKGSRLPADILVSVPADQDRKAYDAMEKGEPPSSVLSDYPDKPRVDEAYLEKEHIPDSQAPDPEADLQQPPRPLVDLMLQRALQLHRGLRALKREVSAL
jgi:hypothetical protein